jgi:hypothetical protein
MPPYDAKERAITWALRTTSIISLAGSIFVVGTFLFSSRFQAANNRLLFFAVWGNIMANVAHMMSTMPIKHGQDSAFCQFQAFLLQWYVSIFSFGDHSAVLASITQQN